MLSSEQLNHFRAQLELRRASLRADVAAAQGQLAQTDATADAVGDYGDDGNTLYAHSEALGDLGGLQALLAQVERALGRVDAGTYGYSEVSGRPIPLERLEALPYATTLVGEPVPA